MNLELIVHLINPNIEIQLTFFFLSVGQVHFQYWGCCAEEVL